MQPSRRSAIALSLVLAAACAETPEADAPAAAPAEAPTTASRPDLPDGVEARSFLGEDLSRVVLSDAAREVYTARYEEAERALAATPQNVDSLVWMGRRTAYLGRFRDAIDIYTRAIALHPDDARLYRHRGHRYVSVRELDRAIADFERAAELTDGSPDEVEPDGLPNERGVPTSTLQFNIWYHLGLAHYLAGDFAAAAEAYERCAEVSVHPDSKVATAYWRVLTLKRLGRDAEAGEVMADITPAMDVIESGGYLDLIMLFKGRQTPEELIGPAGSDATLAGTTATYGVGMWYLLNGDEAEAERLFRQNLTGREAQWAAFGYIASEAELARMGAEG